MLREQVQGQIFIFEPTDYIVVVRMSNYPQLILPTREDMIVKIKKHEKIPTLGEILEMRAQAREQLFTVGQLDKVGQNGPSVEKPSS